MSDPFSAFEALDAAADALGPAVRTVLDASASTAERAAAIAALRADRTAADSALRSVSDDDADRLALARALFDTALAELDAPDLVALAQNAVEAALLLGDHEVAGTLAARALAARPDDVRLALLRANVEANQGRFDPGSLARLVEGTMRPDVRRRLYANLGVLFLATGRAREGLDAWHHAAADVSVLMASDAAVFTDGARGPHAWPQRMRDLLILDGLGELASVWGLGGPRMIVLLEGLALETKDPATAALLQAEAAERLRRGRAEFTVDPDFDDVTLESLLADAADFAKQCGLDALAARFA